MYEYSVRNLPMTVCEHQWSGPFSAPTDPTGWGRDDQFERCARCGVIHTLRMVPPSAPSYDRADYHQRDGMSWRGGATDHEAYMRSRLPPLRLGGLDGPHGDRRLLQIGPGLGQMTPTLLKWDWRVECCEIGEWPARFLAETYPAMTVHRADWMTWQPPHQFDAITANHALEHFEYAPAAICKMVHWLAPGGVLYLELPAALLDDGQINDHAWQRHENLHNHDHWWHFSERTLRMWYEALGLKRIAFANTIREHEDNKLMDYHAVGRRPG
jgi:SAM-dependent methyltransferase